jgi:transcriptional regulator GlxA family with amidase domain
MRSRAEDPPSPIHAKNAVAAKCWVERFSILSDAQIAKAFSEMVSNPGAPHTIQSVSQTACLSRSAFMARFVAAMGRPPIIILRELRMRQAAQQLSVNGHSISSHTFMI